MKSIDSRSVSEGAMMVAFTAILIVFNIYVPFFSIVGVFFTGIPLACLIVRKGAATTAISFLAVFFITLFMINDVLTTISFVLLFVLPGVVVGYCKKFKLNFYNTLTAAALSVLLAIMIEILTINLMFNGSGMENLVNQSMEQFEKYFKLAANDIPSLKTAGAGNIDEFTSNLVENMKNMIFTYFPSAVVITSIFTGYIVLMVSSELLNRLKVTLYKGTVPFYLMKAPKSMGYITAILYFIVKFSTDGSIYTKVLANIVFILYFIIGICGFSFVDFKIREKIKSGVLRVAVYIVSVILGNVFLPIIFNILIILGLIDSVFNFRKIQWVGDDNVI